MAVHLIFGDKNPDMIAAWTESFAGVPDVTIRGGNLLLATADALVSPANSFGFMDGGIDWSISELFEWKIQSVVQDMIKKKHAGELVVGAADIVQTGHERFKFLICAPTMRTPANAATTINAYLAMRATLICINRHNASGADAIRTVAIPGFCTGIGRMPPDRCARQMRAAYDSVLGPNADHLKSLSEAHTEELLLKS